MNYIDLFAGAGGLSEGFKRVGFNPVAHVEMNQAACLTLKTRAAKHYLTEHGKEKIYYKYLLGKITREELYSCVPRELEEAVLNARLSKETLEATFKQIDKTLKKARIDLIIGGPPCQVYSQVGRSRIGVDKVKHDIRYSLYEEYGEFLKKYRPKFFVFENVNGLLTIEKGKLFKEIQQFLRDCGYEIDYEVLNASSFGVMQHRNRVIIIGRRGKRKFKFPSLDENPVSGLKIKEILFKDLPRLNPGDEPALSKYKGHQTNIYLRESLIRNGVSFTTQHITRPHNERDLEIYSIAIEKWLSNRERLKYPDLPQKLKTHQNENGFFDRFKVIDPFGLSHTVMAHLAKDGHYFIYPDLNQVRSISVREAARIQSFPDDFYFEGGRGAAFRQIGNAVPPLLAWHIASKIKELI